MPVNPEARKTPEVRAFWADYRRVGGLANDAYDVVSYGDGPKLAETLTSLTAAGTKRATAGLLRDFKMGLEPMPRVGGYVVLLDAKGRPRLIWRTTEVTVKPFIEVDAAFAFDEGEGDRSLADWLKGHRRYFTRQAAREGFEFDDRSPTVFERFRVVWPPELADSAS